jgi:hypothetical protein
MLGFLLIVSAPYAHARSGSSVVLPVSFNVSPEGCNVYQITLDGTANALGTADQKLNVELRGDAAAGKRDAIFRFTVPVWFGGEYPNFGQLQDKPKDDVDLTAFQIIVGKASLTRGQVPADGSRFHLPLPLAVRLQAWSLLHPLLSLVVLGLGGLLLRLVARWRAVLGRLSAPKTAQRWQDDSTAVGEYRLKQKIGEGGMGEVWAATSASQLHCALKFVRQELANDPEFKRRFEREIKACLPLRHPHLLRLYGYGVAVDGRLYTVSELLQGRTLKQVIRSGELDPPQLAAKVLEQVGDALGYLHSRNLVHRDVKPDNIFVCDDGTLKLMDMGLIKGDEYTSHTQTGHILGTPAYMAPEQDSAKAVGPASDQYSLGIIMYEMLAGQRPFVQPEMAMLVFQHKFTAPAPLSEVEPRVAPEVEQGVLRMLAKDPQERFASLKEAQEALEPLGFMTWKDSGEDTQAAIVKKLPD